jgi:predicted ATPase with chaperone activity
VGLSPFCIGIDHTRGIVNSSFIRPQDRVLINLAPADLPKQAASFDLPVALGILADSGQLIADRLEHYAIIGELALEGHTRPVKGSLSIAIEAAKNEGLHGIVLPSENASEAAVVEGLDVIPVDSFGLHHRGDMLHSLREVGCIARGDFAQYFGRRLRGISD